MPRGLKSYALSMMLVACAQDPVDTDSGSVDTGEPQECPSYGESALSMTHKISGDDISSDVMRTKNNPLKGFMTSYLWGEPVSDFPDQMEFLYLPMSELWSAEGEIFATGLEPYLAESAARGHHAVLRVFIDYPGRPSGLPEFLQEQVQCSMYTEHGGGCSPDYDDPDLVQAMLGLIASLGEAYDGDDRLGFLQVGLMGFWGEWHTYPHTDWFPSEDTQKAVLNAFDVAFEKTQMQVRRAAVNSVDLRMGFHDDSFAYSTIGDVPWFFVPGLETAGASERWQEVTIGGELRPELQPLVFNEDYQLGDFAQDVSECIEATHASYLLNYYAYNGDGQGYVGVARSRAEDAALQLGYQFELTEAEVSVSALYEDTAEVSVSLELSQTGVAPFYYPLTVTIASPHLENDVRNNEDLRSLLPGQSRTVDIHLGRVSIELLKEPIYLRLDSTMLQTGQQILLATGTPWSEEQGATGLQWDFTCEANEVIYVLGDKLEQTADACDCLCDVDGQFRGANGELCDPDSKPDADYK